MIPYSTPAALLEDPSLTLDEKVRILREWEYDQLEIAVAQDEGMSGPDPDWLGVIKRALGALTESVGARE